MRAVIFLVAVFLGLSFIKIFSQDRTLEYLQQSGAATASDQTQLVNELKDYHILFVPGFLSNFFTGMGRNSFTHWLHLSTYFQNQMDWSKANGIEYSLVDVESEASPEENSLAISAQITSIRKPIIIVGHSKGNVDILVTLLGHAHLQSKIKGWISLQGAFYGSPLADWTNRSKILRGFARWLVRVMGGNIGSLVSLQTGVSKARMDASAGEIAQLTHAIPVISFVSYVDKQPWRISTLLFLSRNFMLKKFGRNDGLLPVASGILPGSQVVLLPQVDHADPVMPSFVRRFDRVGMLKNFCALVLRQVPRV